MMLSNLTGGGPSQILKNTPVRRSVLQQLASEWKSAQNVKTYVADCGEIQTKDANDTFEGWQKSSQPDPDMLVGPGDRPDLFCAKPTEVVKPDDDDDELIPRTEDERMGEILEKVPKADRTPAMNAAFTRYQTAQAIKAAVDSVTTAKTVDVSKAFKIIKTIALLLLKNPAYKNGLNGLNKDAAEFKMYNVNIHRMPESAFAELMVKLFEGKADAVRNAVQRVDAARSAAVNALDVEIKAKMAAAYLFFAERQCAAVVKPMKECNASEADVADYATGAAHKQDISCARVGKTKICTSKRNLELHHGESKIADLTALLTKLNREEKAGQALKAKKVAAAYSLSGGSQLRDLLARA